MDQAVGEFGRALEAELRDIEGKTKKEIQGKADRMMRQWLGLPQRYRTPVATRTKE